MQNKAPTPADVLDVIRKCFDGGQVCTPEEAKALKEAVEKLINPGRGSTLDFTDPANTGLLPLL